jgi:hypothetical protein
MDLGDSHRLSRAFQCFRDRCDDTPLTAMKSPWELVWVSFPLEELGAQHREPSRMQGFIVRKGVRECPV